MMNWQRIMVGGVVLASFAVLLAVSIVANFKFAYSLGQSDFEGRVLGAAGVASDFLKAACPVAFFWFISRKQWWPTAAAATLGLVTATFSLNAAIGFMSTERFAYYDKVTLQAEVSKDRVADLRAARDRREWVPMTRPAPIIEAEIAAMKMDRIYKKTKGCQPSSGDWEKWCRTFRQLSVDLVSARVAVAEDAKLELKRGKLGDETSLTGDAQVETVSRVTGVNSKAVLIAMVFLAVALIEIGSAFGLTVGLALLVPDKSNLGKALGILKRKPSAPMPERNTVSVTMRAVPKDQDPEASLPPHRPLPARSRLA